MTDARSARNHDSIPFIGVSVSSVVSRLSADGTAADVAAPAETVWPDAAPGNTSLHHPPQQHSTKRIQIGRTSTDSPLDLKPRNPRLTINIPNQPLPHHLLRWLSPPLLVIILRILIIPHPYELLIFVASRQYQSSDAKDVFARDFGGEGRGAAEFKGVCARGDWTD